MAIWQLILFIFGIVWVLGIITWTIIEAVKGEPVKEVHIKDSGSGKGTVNVNGDIYNYQYTPNVLTIENSYNIRKKFIKNVLMTIKNDHPDMIVWRRSMKSLRREWYCHNLAYKWGIKKDRTKDIDLNYSINIFAEAAYFICGPFAYIFIK